MLRKTLSLFVALLAVLALTAMTPPQATAYHTAPLASMEAAKEAEKHGWHRDVPGAKVPATAAVSVYAVSDSELKRRQEQSASDRIREMAYWYVKFEPGDVFYSDGHTLYNANNKKEINVNNAIGGESDLSEGMYVLTDNLEFSSNIPASSKRETYVSKELRRGATNHRDGVKSNLSDPDLVHAGDDVIYRVAELAWAGTPYSRGDHFYIVNGMMYALHGDDWEPIGETTMLNDGEVMLGQDFHFKRVSWDN